MGLKRLYFDIEVSPNLGFFWNPGHKINLSYENIIKERAIICICYKWQHERKIHSLTWDGRQNDRNLLKEFIKIANQADELVGHNGDAFDIKWIRTRCFFHNIPMFPKYVTVDTYKFSKSHFRFNSNRLNYIGQFSGSGQKLHTSFDLWKDIVLKNCESSLNKMVRYCKRDVHLLQSVYEKMINYIPAKTHYGVMIGETKRSCPECGTACRINKTYTGASGVKKHQMVCKKCGKNHTVTGNIDD